jgi:hypothetical protein
MEQPASLLPDPGQSNNWGMFGYRGAMCDRAIKADNAPMLKECLDRGFFDPDDQMLSFKTVRAYCKEVAPRCFEMLETACPQVAA